MIPVYYSADLTFAHYDEITSYLGKAFHSPLHPLHGLMSAVCDCFNATYGGVRIHPRLLKHAVDELRSLEARIYRVVHALFPALPPAGAERWVENLTDVTGGGEESERRREDVVVTASAVVLPHLLPRVHSSVFMLYALRYKRDDDEYWARILKWNKHPDIALLTFLDVSQKFWTGLEDDNAGVGVGGGRPISLVKDAHFVSAVETLQRVKTEFTPREKLSVILATFREVNACAQRLCGPAFTWSMDELFPVFQYVVVRARILQLGAEIHLIENLMEPHLCKGETGIVFTTLQAGYYQILKESLSI